MDLNWIEDFIALVEAGNFSRAADRRNVTQPAFSRRIRALEDWAGIALFDRTSHRIALTAAGREFQAEAGGLLRRASLARERARDAAGGSTRSIRFACTHLLSSTFFPAWLSGLELTAGHEFPFQFLVDTMVACERMMVRNEARLLLCHHHERARSELEDSGFLRITLAEDRLVPVSAAGEDGVPLHPLRAGSPVAYLEHRPESGLARILTRSGLRSTFEECLRPVFFAHAALTLLTMTRAGRGMTWMPLSAVADDLETGRLVRAGDADSELSIDICLLRPNRRQEDSLETFLAALSS